MKKNIFIITCLLLIQLVMAQSPGGVSGMAAWYKSDAGLTATTWADQSPNGYNLTRTSAPVSTSFINFNSVASFDGITNHKFNNTSTKVNWPVGTSANTYYYVAKNRLDSGGTSQVVYGIGPNWTEGIFSGRAGNSSAQVSTARRADLPTTDAQVSTVTSPNWLLTDNNLGLNLVRSGYTGTAFYTAVQSNTEVTGTVRAQSNLTTHQFAIGATVDNIRHWTGDIAEVIVYPGKHTATDYNKVESYLAIKYGITKTGNYIASNGTVVYNDATYNNSIAGIGRDDTSGLHQRQSQSQNSGVQPVIGNNSTIIASNTTGAGDFATDNDFMLWGSDTGSDKIETTFAFGTMNARMGKIWKIQETNTVGTVKVALRKSDFNGTNQHLLVSNDATFDGSDNMITMSEETIGGVVYYTTTVDFTNGQFFTFASYVVAPGGVLANFSAWFKADAATFSDAGTTLATNGTTVQQWDDQSGSGYNLSQATVGNRPVYYNSATDKLVNFNPSIEYVSSDRLVNANRLMPISSAHSFFGVAIDQATATGYKMIFSCDNSDDQYELYKGYTSGNGVSGWIARRSGNDYRLVNGLNNNNVIGGNGFSASGGSNGFWNGTNYSANLGVQPQVFGLLGNGTAAGSGVSFLDGYKATNTSSVGTPANWFGRFSVGARTGGGNPFIGRIPEIIAYNRQLTDTEAQKINSYLAIKYGTTLGQGGVNIVNNNGNNYNYLDSDGNIVWNATSNSAYKYHIAGIGRDDASALNQKQSQSQNATETNQVIFGLGSVVATNAANTNTFTADKQFLLWGDNGASGPVAFSDTADATIFSRLARTWFVDNSNSYAQDTQLLIPVALTTGGSSPKLILNTNDSFADGTNTYIPLSTTTTINSVSYYVVNLTAAQVANDFYFTVATNQKAPGGVATDLRFWLNMSSFASSQWTDLSGNNNHFLSTNVNKQPPIEIAKERANFHASADFRQSSWGGTQDLMHKPAPGPFTANNLDATIFASLSRESDTGYRDVIGFGGGANTATPLTFNVGADSPVWTAEPSGNHTMSLYPWRGPEFVTTTPTNGTLNQVLTTSKTHIPDVTWRYNQANGVDYALDGYQVTAAINPGTISGASGAVIDGQAEINDGRISELIGYERSLTTLEKQKIRSYLALKYGVSQNQYVATNYLNSNGDIVWDATANSGFKSDIAGIGKDDFGALNQVMSKSINNAAEPLLSLTAIPSSASNDTQASLVSFDNNNQYLIWGNNATRGFTPFTNAIDADINVRLSRIWKAQTSNYNITGDDDIVFNFPEASVKPFINSGAAVYLVLSTTPDFSSGNYLVAIPTTTTLIDGRSYISLIYDVSSNAFAGITSNGNFYFTVAGKGQGPGGVLGIFWNRADKDLLTSGTTVTKWTDQMYGIESTQVADNTNRPVIGTDATLFNFNPYVNFTAQTQTLGNESVAPAEGFTSHIEQFFIHKDNNYTDTEGQWFGLNYDLRSSASGGFTYDWNSFERNYYRSRLNVANGATTTTNFVPAPSTSVLNMSHLISDVPSTTFGYRGNGSTVTNTSNANYNYIGQGGFVYGSDEQGTGLVGDDQGVTGQLAEHLIVGEALTATERRQVESYLAVKYGITISDLTSDASYRDASGNATFTTDAAFRYDIFGIAKEAAAGIDQRISKSINNDAGNATNIITVSTDTNFTNLNATHADALSDAQYLIFASNNGAVAFSGGSAITAADGTVFSATEVLATRWKVQDKGGVGCVNMRFNNAAFTAVTGSTKYYMIVADDAAFTQNVTYREVTRDASSNIDVTVNFGDNTNGSATTGNYFTIARKNLGITATNLATVQTGINTIPSITNWKPTVANTYMEINSNAKGVIVTRVADVTPTTIASPIEGMMVFDLSDNKFKVYTGTSWRTLGISEGSSATFCN